MRSFRFITILLTLAVALATTVPVSAAMDHADGMRTGGLVLTVDLATDLDRHADADDCCIVDRVPSPSCQGDLVAVMGTFGPIAVKAEETAEPMGMRTPRALASRTPKEPPRTV